MAGSVYGRHYVISTWGESHGDTVGVVVDGVQTPFDMDFLLNRICMPLVIRDKR